MTTLKEETIRGIQAEQAFDMSAFGNYNKLSRLKKRKPSESCGTACCIAGHIVAAAARLGRKLPKTSEVRTYKRNGKYDRRVEELFDRKGLRDDIDEVPRAARLLWARSYGKEAANRLDFTNWGHYPNLERVTPNLAVAHLEGENSNDLASAAGLNEFAL